MNHPKLVVFGIVIFSIFAIVHLGPTAYADTVAKSTAFEKTTLIEYVNNENVPIKSVKMWLGQDAGTFKSFKTEMGWTGTKTEQGLLIFTAETPLDPGKSVKFGIKTEIQSPGINWRTLDANGNELTIGRTEAGQQATTTPKEVVTPPQDNTQKTPVNLDGAVFRIIPESPKNGDSIRVVGDGFPPSKTFGFFINNERLEDFATDESGHLIGTAKIPINTQADRVEFSLVDNEGNKKTISIRITYKEVQPVTPRTTQLTITQMTEIVEPGKTASVSGTAKPGSTITISYKDASGVKIQAAAVPVDAQGNWSHERIISPDAELGTRTVEFTDGVDTISKTLSVSVSKSIRVTPSAIKYNPGEKMLFNGTALSNQPVEVVIKDPIGKEIFSDILKMNGTEAISFEFPTDQSSPKGTYVILFTQADHTEILRVGLGEAPSQQIVAKFDKLNYSVTEKAKMVIKGMPKTNVSILIIDPSDKAKLSDTTTLGAEGSADYEIDLTGYKSGVYSVVLRQLKSQVEVVFAVGLQQGSGEIKIQSTKQKYQLADNILLLGSTDKPNVLLTLAMIDPSGKIIKQREVFSDEEGKFSDGTFRIPSDAVQGIWTIKASSGANSADAKLEVVGTVTQAFVVNTSKSTPYVVGETVTMSGNGAGRTQTAIIEIYNSNNVKVQELIVTTTDDGDFQTIWVVPTGIDAGNYRIKATVGNQIAETSFKIQ